jgi:hypothetical protein
MIPNLTINLENQTPNQWWAKCPAELKRYMRGVMTLVENMVDGEALEVRTNGQVCNVVLKSDSDPAKEQAGIGAKVDPRKTDDEWWHASPSALRGFVRELSCLLLQSIYDKRKVVEIRSGTDLSASLVLKLSNPIRRGGKPETN